MGKKSSLITCKHCGQVIAASAKACPHCGGKNGKPVYKKWWFWVLVGFFAIGIMGNAVGEKSATIKSENSAQPKNTLSQNIGESVTEATKDTHTPIPVPTEKPQDKVPTEYRNALKKAETYSEMMHMSKKGIYDQLTSEYGEKFDADAAQYAIDLRAGRSLRVPFPNHHFNKNIPPFGRIFLLERVMGLEPTISAWKANVLPLHYTRVLSCKWCGRRDLNSYALRHWNLNPARLPIPPRPQAHYSNLVTRRRFELRTP